MLRKFDAAVVFLTSLLVGVLMLVMCGATLAGVFARYLLNDALSWSEEVARYSMVWMSFLGGGLVFRYGGHIAIDTLVARIPAGAVRHLVVGFAHLVVVAFLVVLAWYGYSLMMRGTYMTTAALRLPMSIPYAAIPIGAVMMIYHLAAANLQSLGKQAEPHSKSLDTALG